MTLDTILPRMTAWIDQYALWLYGAAAVGLLLCIRAIWVARRDKKQSIFKLERELAISRESRAFSIAALLIGVIVAVSGFKFYLAPNIDLTPPTATPSPTSFLFETPPTREVPTETPTAPPPTRTPRPTARPTQPSAPPTATAPPAVACANPGACITSPVAGQRVSGAVPVRGTANIAQFQFYKVEYGLGEDPQQWHSLSDIHRQAVADGLLDTWNATGFPPGVYKLRLTVVDVTGNWTTPHEVRVIIE